MIKKRQNSRKEEDFKNSDVECSSGGHAGLSSYELERLENIRQNQSFLSSINLFQATEELKQVMLPKPSKRGLLRSQAAVEKGVPVCKSLRIQSLILPPNPREMQICGRPHKKPPGPLLIKPVNMKEEAKLPSQLLELFSEGRVWGNNGMLRFEPHTRAVACIAFSSAHLTHLLSLSHDGSVHCMDVEKAVFDDVYDNEEKLKTFDFMSLDCTTLMVGYYNGKVAIVDRRTPGNSHEFLHSLKSQPLLCVSIHPLQKQYFAVADNKLVNIYDSRYLKKKRSKAVSYLHGHSSNIHGDYFSPRTGNRVLTSDGGDGYIRIYDTSAMIKKAPLRTSIRNKMRTVSSKIKLSAVWDPKWEDCFVMGSKSKTHSMKVFHESGRPQHSFIDYDNVTSELSVTAFHPTRNALLGGSVSGQLHFFSD